MLVGVEVQSLCVIEKCSKTSLILFSFGFNVKFQTKTDAHHIHHTHLTATWQDLPQLLQICSRRYFLRLLAEVRQDKPVPLYPLKKTKEENTHVKMWNFRDETKGLNRLQAIPTPIHTMYSQGICQVSYVHVSLHQCNLFLIPALKTAVLLPFLK